MVEVIVLLNSFEQYLAYRRNLYILGLDLGLIKNMITFCADENLYIELRNADSVLTSTNNLILWYQEDSFIKNIQEVNNSLRINPEYVFILEGDYLIPAHCLQKLLVDYIEHPMAGFVSAVSTVNGEEFYYSKDIYDGPDFTILNEKDLTGGVLEIDTALPKVMLIRKQVFDDNFDKKLDGFGQYSFGIKLRRQGYKNYLDTGVICKEVS